MHFADGMGASLDGTNIPAEAIQKPTPAFSAPPSFPAYPVNKHKMFARLIAATLLALPIFVAATIVEKRQAGSCNVGELQCCNSVQEVSVSLSLVLLAPAIQDFCSNLHGQFTDRLFSYRLTPSSAIPSLASSVVPPSPALSSASTATPSTSSVVSPMLANARPTPFAVARALR